MTQPRAIVIGPLPPPSHGVAVSTALALANGDLRRRFDVVHLDTSDSRGRANIGRWDVENVRLALANALRLIRLLRGSRGVVYLPISQNVPAFLRDSLFIVVARARGWRVAAHLRGSELRDVCARAPLPFRLWARLTLRLLDSFGVMGDSLRPAVAGLVSPERVVVVPNGTPDPQPGPWDESRSTVLFLSNLRRRKGVREAVEAALVVVDRNPAARFVFAGDWEDDALEAELRARAASAGERIRFVGSVDGDEKRDLLVSSAALLFPPVEPEGHPRVVLEAIAAGLPVVTTDRGAISETIVDGECGFVLPDPDPAELADRVLDLLQDGELRKRLADGARARYQDRFTQERADAVFADWLWRVHAAANGSTVVLDPSPAEGAAS